MLKLIIRSLQATWLSILLTAAQPAWASGPSCSGIFSNAATATPLSPTATPFIDKNGLIIESSVFRDIKKAVVFAPVSSWGRGENAKNLFTLALRVESHEQGLAFFNQLAQQLNSHFGHNGVVISKNENTFEIPGLSTLRIHPPHYTRHLPMNQGPIEIEIQIHQSTHEVTIANQISAILQNVFKLKSTVVDLRHLTAYDLTTSDARSAWGQEAFHEWLKNLSANAKTMLSLISGPEYRDILPFLRDQGRSQSASLTNTKLQELTLELDAAIQRGRIPVPVKLYRASADPYSLEAWTRLSADAMASVEKISDNAYTFTSLDQSFVQSWNRHELRGRGIIIEIEASPGLRAGYVDRGPHERDYAEIILARGQTLTPVRAYTDNGGQKRLVVKAR